MNTKYIRSDTLENTLEGVKTSSPTNAVLRTLISTLGFTLSSAVFADEAIIIGGGNSLLSSQAQIELNIQYAKESLQDKDLNVTTFFTDGGEPGLDVFTQHQEPLDPGNEPLARVFGDYLEQYREYRSSALDNIAGSTRRETLLPELTQRLSVAESPIWLLYNGHGNQSYSTTDQVTLELWDKTRVTAEELHAVLDATDQPVRYAFTQCYSGGFHALAYDEPYGSMKPASPQRCGFTAVSAYSLAEGCSASINTGDYRDYTTHFFAALTGYDRNGNVVLSEPDSDNNGDVSPREAHFYSLLNANSTDISRATSEDFLERWEPWYLKWTPGVKDLPSNEYAKLFRELASNLKVSLDQGSIGVIRDELETLTQRRDETRQNINKVWQEVQELRDKIAAPIIAQWPAVLGPYTAGYQTLVSDGTLPSISEVIEADTNYSSLVASQNLIADLQAGQLELARQSTNLQKLLHLRHMATLKQQLLDFWRSNRHRYLQRLCSMRKPAAEQSNVQQQICRTLD